MSTSRPYNQTITSKTQCGNTLGVGQSFVDACLEDVRNLTDISNVSNGQSVVSDSKFFAVIRH